MKKFLRILLMLTCVLGLTACGKDDTISDFQQSKIEEAEYIASTVVDLMDLLVENGTTVADVAELNNVELANQFTSLYLNYTSSSTFECTGKGVRTGISSFAEGLDKMGGIIEIGTPSSVVDDDQIIVTIPIDGINCDGSVEVIVSNDIFFSMSACTLNIDESFGSLMGRAGLNTLIGMGTVFIVLILISLIISLFGFIPNIQNAFKKKDKKAQVSESTPAPVTETVEEELADDTELVAVIAAAIAAYEGTSADGFQVRSIKRANTKNWQRQ